MVFQDAKEIYNTYKFFTVALNKLQIQELTRFN